MEVCLYWLEKKSELDIKLTIKLIIMSFLKEIYKFILVRRKFWLIPILIVLLIFGGLFVITQGTAVAPFVYTIF